MKKRQLELNREMAEPGFWDSRETAMSVIDENNSIKAWLEPLDDIKTRLDNIAIALELMETGPDSDILDESSAGIISIEKRMDRLEFIRMLSGKHDRDDAILTIRSGAGGQDSQDWAEILMKMYIHWAERQEYEVEVLSVSEGGVEGGIREAVMGIRGPWAYGYLRAEGGIHRLVRKSPFDQNHRRHTSFASVFPLPDIEDDIEVELNDDDIRVDTFRASGAGGQHVNKTSSAVRMTHLPTGITVTCQNQRSQHRNREVARRILKARIYELEEDKRLEEKARLEKTKKDVSWGNQIRSYVMHPYQMVKDHRTGMETSGIDDVLAGDIQGFIEEYLRTRGKE
ncbi:MAG: peptide chain release factor 2 [Candidatus Aegiribacteria sp. MLS_C]|nr:MAG: peptide chain release factor 2 [Candidatus Aegiribacteria sp. MLS_C]